MAKFSFYRPHERVQEHGELVNPITGEVTQPPSMTKQEFLKECDINTIIKAFSLTGQIDHISAKAAQGAFQDLPDPFDFQESMNTVIQAEKAFMDLPAKVRDRFHNEPAEFLEFMQNPDNTDEAISLGLAEAPPRETPPPGPITAPPDEKTS